MRSKDNLSDAFDAIKTESKPDELNSKIQHAQRELANLETNADALKATLDKANKAHAAYLSTPRLITNQKTKNNVDEASTNYLEATRKINKKMQEIKELKEALNLAEDDDISDLSSEHDAPEVSQSDLDSINIDDDELTQEAEVSFDQIYETYSTQSDTTKNPMKPEPQKIASIYEKEFRAQQRPETKQLIVDKLTENKVKFKEIQASLAHNTASIDSLKSELFAIQKARKYNPDQSLHSFSFLKDQNAVAEEHAKAVSILSDIQKQVSTIRTEMAQNSFAIKNRSFLGKIYDAIVNFFGGETALELNAFNLKKDLRLQEQEQRNISQSLGTISGILSGYEREPLLRAQVEVFAATKNHLNQESKLILSENISLEQQLKVLSNPHQDQSKLNFEARILEQIVNPQFTSREEADKAYSLSNIIYNKAASVLSWSSSPVANVEVALKNFFIKPNIETLNAFDMALKANPQYDKDPQLIKKLDSAAQMYSEIGDIRNNYEKKKNISSQIKSIDKEIKTLENHLKTNLSEVVGLSRSSSYASTDSETNSQVSTATEKFKDTKRRVSAEVSLQAKEPEAHIESPDVTTPKLR